MLEIFHVTDSPLGVVLLINSVAAVVVASLVGRFHVPLGAFDGAVFVTQRPLLARNGWQPVPHALSNSTAALAT